EGKPSGYLSSRAAAWIDTDAARSGVPAAVFDEGFGYEQWVDYLLDVPMYFIHDGDSYQDVAGLSFRDFMDGTLPGYEGRFPVISDWEDHTTTAFPEVRLKRFLEMRGADGGDWGMICALPAFWVGLLYDEEALDAAYQMVKTIGAEDVLNARMSAAKDGLRGQLGDRDMADLAKQVLSISEQGLSRRKRLNDVGDDETGYLQPIKHLIDKGETQADRLLGRFHKEWKQDIKPLYDVYRLKS
ncbi:MAG: glutamate-cysteine ligase family protein, partial [Proteobacteria bacterium]|nr:glutamate-cysteine ligase family protein [Pseudomonadota bacterium]